MSNEPTNQNSDLEDDAGWEAVSLEDLARWREENKGNPDAPLYKVRFSRDGGRQRRFYNKRDFEEAVAYAIKDKARVELERERLEQSGSAGAAWLMKYRAEHQDTIQPIDFDFEGAEKRQRFYIKQVSDSDVVEMGVIMAREGFSLVSLEDVKAQKLFAVALLTVGVVRGEDDACRFFTNSEEAQLFCDLGGTAAQIATSLRAALLAINPIFAKKNTITPLAIAGLPGG